MRSHNPSYIFSISQCMATRLGTNSNSAELLTLEGCAPVLAAGGLTEISGPRRHGPRWVCQPAASSMVCQTSAVCCSLPACLVRHSLSRTTQLISVALLMKPQPMQLDTCKHEHAAASASYCGGLTGCLKAAFTASEMLQLLSGSRGGRNICLSAVPSTLLIAANTSDGSLSLRYIKACIRCFVQHLHVTCNLSRGCIDLKIWSPVILFGNLEQAPEGHSSYNIHSWNSLSFTCTCLQE